MTTSTTGFRDDTAREEDPTLVDMFAHHSARHGSDIALRFFDIAFSWHEIDDASDAFARYLAVVGVDRGDRVALQLQNCPQFLISLLGAWKRGAAVVLIGPMYRTEETHGFLRKTSPLVLVTHPDLWEDVGRSAREGTTVAHVVTTDHRDLLSADQPELIRFEDATTLCDVLENFAAGRDPRQLPGADDLAVIAFTSGTTGSAKGSRTLHRNLSFAATRWTASSGVAGPGHVMLSVAPYVHITGTVANIAAWIVTGCEMVQMYRFDPARAIDLLIAHEVTWMVGAATVYIAMLQVAEQRAPHAYTIRNMLSGGAPIPWPLVERLRTTFGAELGPGWGMTETTTLGTTTPHGELIRRDDATGVISVGTPSPCVAIRIVDESNAPLPPRAHGEVLISGPNIVDGYWDDPAESEKAIVDGWLHTGDVGFVDEDGWLYLVDRTKNMIIASGYKVWPREVEEVLCRIPGVREAAVIGVPDEYRGETVRAFVAPSSGAPLDTEAITTFCREHLAAYKVPRIVSVVEEIPKNANGKVQRDELRRL